MKRVLAILLVVSLVGMYSMDHEAAKAYVPTPNETLIQDEDIKKAS